MATLEKKKHKKPQIYGHTWANTISNAFTFFLLHLMGNTKKQLKQSEVELIWDERLKGEGEEDASS